MIPLAVEHYLGRRLYSPAEAARYARVPAETLVNAYRTEGSLPAAADAFGVSPSDVDAAYRYFDHLGVLNAA